MCIIYLTPPTMYLFICVHHIKLAKTIVLSTLFELLTSIFSIF